MELKRTVIESAVIKTGGVGAREIEAIASETKVDRMGDIVVAAGCRLHEIRGGLAVLAQHDHDQPIARTSNIWRSGDRIMTKIQFPPEGTSARSDEYLRLVKTGVINSLSIGFLPHEYEQMRDTGGYKFTDWSLLEISLVSVPALPSATITAKRAPAPPGSFATRAQDRINRIKADPQHRAYRGQQAAELDAEQAARRRAAERKEIDRLWRDARADFERIFRQ